MTQVIQSGQHPDADQLNAFVEHALPPHEQLQMLAHLAVCPECRAIAYLAQPEFVEAAAHSRPAAVRRPWFSGWHLALPVGLAAALLVVVSVHLHNINTSQRATEADKTARMEKPPSLPQTVAPSAQVPMPKAIPAPIRKPQTVPAAPMVGFGYGSASSGASHGDAHPVALGGYLSNAGNGAVATPNSDGFDAVPGARIITGSSITSNGPAATAAANAPSSAPAQMAGIGNVDAARRELRSSASQYNSSAVAAQSTVNQNLISPAPAAPPPAPGAMAQTVTVSAAPPLLETESNDSAQVIDGRALASFGALKMKKAPSLPSHLAVASTVSNSRQELAIDTAGSLFRSEDAGVSWQPVRVQWTGRAVKLQLSPAPNSESLTKSAKPAAATGSEKGAPGGGAQTTFELTNQAGNIWISTDGQTWKHR